MGQRWKQYEKEGKWAYEQHAFWCTGYTVSALSLRIRGSRSYTDGALRALKYWDLHAEAPDVFLDLSKSNLVIFKGGAQHSS